MNIKLATVVVDCQDAHRTATFYSKLLGWPITLEEPDWSCCGTQRAAQGCPSKPRKATFDPYGRKNLENPPRCSTWTLKWTTCPLRKPMHWPVGR